MLPLNKIDSQAPFIVLVPHSIVLSEHTKASYAAREQIKAVKQGFTNAVVMERTPKGWQVHKPKDNP